MVILMNKKGFTLVELLAVIVILSILAIVTTTIIFKVVSDSRKKIYDANIERILEASEKWAAENIDTIGTTVPYCLDVSRLETEGYITKDSLKDPRNKTSKKIEGYVKISYDNTYKQHEYKYVEECN